jgi:translocation protein SEC62
MYAGNMMWSNIATGLVIFAVVGFTLLPIWPDYAKRILWYLSVTFLIFTLSFCLIRFVLFMVLWLFGYEFWIFPRLFDESLSFQDSFKPIYSFEKGSTGQGYYRIALLLGLVGFTYWAYTQPTEFDGFLAAQKDFIDDLYSGKLLADVAFDPREHMNQQNKKVPSLQDLLKELENDEKVHITEKAEDFYDGENGKEEYVRMDGGENTKEENEQSLVDEVIATDEMEEADVDMDGSTNLDEE